MGFIKKLLIPFFMATTVYASSITTPNMGLVLPVPGTTSGPVWAQMLNTALTKIDQHAHAPGAGVLVSTIGLNIDADLPMHGYNLLLPRSLMFTNNVAALATSLDKNNVYVVNGDLFYNNASGTPVQITSGNSVNVAGVGGITGLGGTSAAVTYSDIQKTFSFTQSSGKTASIAAGQYSLYENTVGANPINIKSPVGLAGAYDFTLPSVLPLETSFVTITSGGQLAGGPPSALGITAANIANKTVTAAKVDSGAASSGDRLAADGSGGASFYSNATTSFSSNGNWTAPAGAHFVIAKIRGGGGGGSSANFPNVYGGGGGGSASITMILPVTPSTVYPVVVGLGGAGGAANAAADGADGGTSSFNGVTVAGGRGGKWNGGSGLGGAPGGSPFGAAAGIAWGGTGGSNQGSGGSSFTASGGVGLGAGLGAAGGGAGDGAGGNGGTSPFTSTGLAAGNGVAGGGGGGAFSSFYPGGNGGDGKVEITVLF